MDEQQGKRLPSLGEGIRSGIGVLAAFKEAIEETIQEASARGDLSPERAKELLGSALHRAQDAAGEVRDRLDLVPRRDFDALREEVALLRARLDGLEGRGGVLGPGSSPPPSPEGPTEARMP
jgi:polyhydroxyalkanoate synthesis regulator phasin